MKIYFNWRKSLNLRLTSLKISAIYLAFGIAWISFSDRILLTIVKDPEKLTYLQSFKGWFYVFFTAWLFYWLIYRHMRILKSTEIALRESNDQLNKTTATVKEQLAQLENSQKALQLSEERYRLIAELTSDYAYAIDITPEGEFQPKWMAEAFFRVTGYQQTDIKNGQDWMKIVVPEDQSLIYQKGEKIRSGESVVTEFRIINKQGKILWLRDYARPKWDTYNNSIIGMVGAAKDITLYKQAEQALRESEEKHRELVNNLKEIVFQQNQQGIWIFLNPAWVEVMGYTVESTLGTSFLDYVYPEDRHNSQQYLELLYQKEIEYCRYEARYLGQDGTIRWLEMFARLLFSANGELSGIAGTLMDITQRKTAETQLQNLNLELELQVEERTAQLVAQMQELAALNSLKDDFLSTVSHELRTPMSNMKMAITMLKISYKKATHINFINHDLEQEKENISKIERYLEILDYECDREINLINDILELRRLDAEPQLLNFKTISLHEWLPKAVASFEERVHNRHQHLNFYIQPDMPLITCHVSSLERIVSELVNNACKYTPPSGKIAISANYKNTSATDINFINIPRKKSLQPAVEVLQIIVSNSGSSIPQNELIRIFEKFYRLPSADPWKQGGTGLGLALVKKLVQHLGGTVWAESESNQTRFIVELPIDWGKANHRESTNHN